MKDIEITNIQKLYLLHLLKNKDKNSITSVAKSFNCTKPNSKNILDNMIKEGFLYKEEMKYILTNIGKDVACYYEDERAAIEKFLNKGLKINLEESINLSYKLIGTDLEDLNKKLIERSENLDIFKSKDGIKPFDIESNLGKGEYIAYLNIQKTTRNSKDSSIQVSMAMKGFQEEAKLIIGDESFIVLEPIAVTEFLKGYSKMGIAFELRYIEKGKENIVEYKDKKFHIPFRIFKNWKLFGGNFLQSSVQLTTVSKIGFANVHKKEANFTIILDLLNLK